MADSGLARQLEGTTMESLNYLIDKYKIDLGRRSPFLVKCNRLIDLPVIFKDLGFVTGAEIGVLEGRYSEILCQSNPNLKVYSIDPWEFYPVQRNFRKPWVYEPLYQKAKEILSKYPNSEIVRKKSMDAVKDFADESLDFVFIDADHWFQQVTNDIAEWSKKVRVGGIVAGHDYGKPRDKGFVHTRYVVHAWTSAYDIHPWFVLDAPYEQSWMWIKTQVGKKLYKNK